MTAEAVIGCSISQRNYDESVGRAHREVASRCADSGWMLTTGSHVVEGRRRAVVRIASANDRTVIEQFGDSLLDVLDQVADTLNTTTLNTTEGGIVTTASIDLIHSVSGVESARSVASDRAATLDIERADDGTTLVAIRVETDLSGVTLRHVSDIVRSVEAL